MNSANWYKMLIKPSWAPPSWLFGPVWSVLYLIIIFSYGTVFYKVLSKQWPAALLWPFALNLFFNLIFSSLQFGLKSNILAALDIILILATLIWAMIAIYPQARWIALVNIPYLCWVAFATILQLTITFLNK
jgi:tryptophan-rich sensory protein